MMRFFRTVYADNGARSRAERRRRLPDAARYLRNALLRPLDGVLARRFARDARGILFIVGAPRSGTTLLHQLIARHLDVAYVSNPLARFWSAPVAGARWLAWRHGAMRPAPLFESDFGRTKDVFGPHEFSWFWHAFGRFDEHDDLRGPELERVAWDAIALRLRALSGLHGRPLVMKSLNFTDYHVEVLAKRLPEARFLWITRDPLYCAQSILEVRRRRYGDLGAWWSVRPRDLAQWADRPPAEQVVHQIRDIEGALERARARLPADAMLALRYEDVVEDPLRALRRIGASLGVGLRDQDELAGQVFKTRNQISLDPTTLRDLERALETVR